MTALHTREISAYGGLVNNMPKYAVAFMVFTMANVGLPGTSGFVGEVTDAARRLPRQHLGRLLRHHRRHPVGGLRALALPPRDLRRAREGQPEVAARPFGRAKR